jgi:signal transduction histidine kinase
MKKAGTPLVTVSLSSRGAGIHYAIGIALVLVIPSLLLCYVYFFADDLPVSRMVALIALLLTLAGLGCMILAKYPRTIIRLRRHLYDLAAGEVPDAVRLLEQEPDIAAIEKSFNLIVSQMKERVATITRQREELLKAERERVMAESLCTACHHLGQPATTLSCCLALLQREELSDQGREHLDLCVAETDRIREMLSVLQNVTKYQTEEYCNVQGGEAGDSLHIIRVTGDRAAGELSFEDRMGRIDEVFRDALARLSKGYVVGTVVELSDGSICLVKSINEGAPASPTVQLVLDKTGNRPEKTTALDLADCDDLAISRAVGVDERVG